ncbi:MAG TPA: carboxypeptidase-like regulatory domain-containing protein [Candidatus Polarisedimenticolia bacterium]|nr:carboxypeptidase-like regulatory domain-containing protein [Candidatus Polarisedimenticolia bacterium]
MRFTSWGLALTLGSLAAIAPGLASDDSKKVEPSAPLSQAAPTPRSVFGTIMGAVLDVKKKPVVGCMVQLSARAEGGTLRVTGTDEKGRYVFKDLPAGIYDIEVAAEGDVSRTKGQIEVRPPFRNIVDFEIGSGAQTDDRSAPGASGQILETLMKARTDAGLSEMGLVPVKGTFLDAQKRPIPEVSVMLMSLQGKKSLQAFSGEDGTFLMPEVSPGRYRVLVSSPGYVSLDLKSVVVLPVAGLNLGLSLVDYPLNFRSRPEDRLPQEEPLQPPGSDR